MSFGGDAHKLRAFPYTHTYNDTFLAPACQFKRGRQGAAAAAFLRVRVKVPSRSVRKMGSPHFL